MPVLRTYSLPSVLSFDCLARDPELPKDLDLFHESDGFRGCLTLIQQGPEVLPPWNGSSFPLSELSKLAASH
jgi:hypothetical protein